MPDEVSLESIPPLPQPDALTQFFWDGTQAHKLLILRCQDCGHYIHYPRPICNKCLSTNLAPGEVSGKGVLDTYTIPMQPIDPYFIEHMPYVYAVVELAEEKNLKIITNIIDCTEEQRHCREDAPAALHVEARLPEHLHIFRNRPVARVALHGRSAGELAGEEESQAAMQVGQVGNAHQQEPLVLQHPRDFGQGLRLIE